MEINQAWIDEQRAVCEKVTPATDGDLRISEDDQILVLVSQHGECRCWRSIFGFRNRDDAEFVINAYINYPAALDALEASMQREAEKDATIARLTSELAAEKKRADAAGQELERMRKWFSDNAAMLAAHRIGGCHFADDGLGAENTDAPTGAESE